MNEWQYYAGTFGHGELTLAKVKMEFRPNIGPNGFFRFEEVERIFYGSNKLVKGLHITVGDANDGLFDDLHSAKVALMIEMTNRVNRLQSQIDDVMTNRLLVEQISE
jgi:hypothetical protein